MPKQHTLYIEPYWANELNMPYPIILEDLYLNESTQMLSFELNNQAITINSKYLRLIISKDI